MPRRKKENLALAEDGNGGLTLVRVDDSPSRVESVPGVQDSEGRAELAGFAFSALLLRNDGWLRVIPCGDGKLNYFKWKYNRGQHRGKYVMFVGAYSDWSGGLLGLYEKVTEVDTGTRKPALDSYGGDGWDP